MRVAHVAAIVFDLDGVLVDSAAVVERAWRRWAEERGIPAADALAVTHGRPARETVRLLAPDLDDAREAARIAEWEMTDPHGVTAIPGAHAAVAFASEGPWAIVTSGVRPMATARLRAVGLPEPEILITADDVTHGKPHPEPYERAAAALGTPAADCVAIEDAPAGIASAKAAGMTVLAVTTTHAAAALQAADRVFASLADVLRHLER